MDNRLGFVGLGQMGQAMTANLVAKAGLSHPLILYNRTRERAEEHSSKIGHSVVARDLAELVSRSEIIWTCLEDDKAIFDTFEQILKTDISGKLFVDCSTILPDSTAELTKKLKTGGADLVAMSVFGEPSMAQRGLLICVPAGPAQCVDRIKPYLTDVICRAVVDLSDEEPSKSSLLKCIGNVLIMTTIEQVAEVHTFAETSGLGTKYTTSLIETLYPKMPQTIYSSKMLNGDYARKESIVDVSKARTLTSKILELADSSKTSLKSYEAAVNHLAVAEDHAGPRCDIMGIYGAVRVESGLPFEIQEESKGG